LLKDSSLSIVASGLHQTGRRTHILTFSAYTMLHKYIGIV
jgi:hypothetical protein